MKYSAKFILAMFNRSKSGKSWVYVDGKTMYVISDAVYNMLKSGEVIEVEFAAGGDLMADDKVTVAFNTMKVKDWTESLASRAAAANKVIKTAESFNQAKYNATKKKLEGLTL